MKNNGKFLVWCNERHYFELDLLPVKSSEVKDEEYVNICTLIDSETATAIETFAFSSKFFVPVFQNKDMEGFKQIGLTLHEIAKKHNLEIVETDKMPKDKIRKDTKKISKGNINEKE
jgi:pyruvate/2-oxoglutarate dehydrogenase complex dihydrolipoamide acyltransferase (E2) component